VAPAYGATAVAAPAAACVAVGGGAARVFIYKEGLVRFCTAPYSKPTSSNLGCAYMHLTNYAVNKHNTEAFVAPGSSSNSSSRGMGCAADSSSGDEAEDDQASAQQQSWASAGGESASKWSFSQLRQHLESQGEQQQQQQQQQRCLSAVNYCSVACWVKQLPLAA
jgi:hypothetical protein